MSSRVFAYGDDAHTYQIPPTQFQDTSHDPQAAYNSNGVDEYAVAQSCYDTQDFAWSGSEADEYVYTQCAHPTDDSMSGDYHQPYKEDVYSHHYPIPGISAPQSPFLPTASTSYSLYTPYTPQFSMPIASSSNIASSFPPETTQSPYYDGYHDSMSYSRVEQGEFKSLYTNTSRDDMITDDGEAYYNDNGSPGGVWMPEMSQNIADGPLAGNLSAAATSSSDEVGVWTKKMQYAHSQQLAPDKALLHQWFEDTNPQNTQDPSAYYPYYPSYPAGIDCSYPTHLSADTRNTPSDFTSSESPLSPLEFETCQSDVSSTISPDTRLAPLPALTSSLVILAQNPPIIHAPRPTRTIDSTYFEQLIATSEISND
ncbi:hypothetical protein J3R30DRAFT_3696989 [Lentinula aciculospora]|uniref:Uncharacterized protein n=1 Tax=Lentinula aciculospora TaxID=153920 RepID=A0A9W9DTT4_9AGAR|nr:hypothetical protein J3R30DRAFT_3696989 [Lentinula aciculospora]